MPIQHSDGTTLCRCPCGKRLLLGPRAYSLEIIAVVNFKREGNLKTGDCPRCGETHLAHIHPEGKPAKTALKSNSVGIITVRWRMCIAINQDFGTKFAAPASVAIMTHGNAVGPYPHLP